MSFNDYLRSKKPELIDTLFIDPNKIKCQYNPDKFRFWAEVCGTSLSIPSSPFFNYLASGDTTKYRKLFRLYGRSEVWITDNIKAFDVMFDSIVKNGFDENFNLPIILKKPAMENPYNNGYEIYEGHRRMTIILFLKLNQRVELWAML